MFIRSLIVALALVVNTAWAEAPRPGIVLNGRVADVVDGDTITVDVTIRYRVRLLDCWAPEVRGGTLESRDMGLASEKHLRELSFDQPATLFIPLTGARTIGDVFSFDRVLGRVWVYDLNLSAAQVSAGHASTTKDGRLGE